MKNEVLQGYLCRTCMKVTPENAPCIHCSFGADAVSPSYEALLQHVNRLRELEARVAKLEAEGKGGQDSGAEQPCRTPCKSHTFLGG